MGNHRFHSVFVSGLIVFLVLLFGNTVSIAGDGKLAILATSDIHSALTPHGYFHSCSSTYQDGGFLRVAERIIEHKIAYGSQNIPTVVLDGGDMVAGTFFHYAYKGAAEIGLLSQLWDATTIGNHDLDWTPDALAGALQAVLAQGIAPLPFICSNIADWGDSPLQGFKDSVFFDYKIISAANGVNIGLMGLMTAGTAALGQPAPLEFTDLSDPINVGAALAVATALRAMGADIIILLAHNGLQYDMAIAQAASAYGVKLDVILSAHDHSSNPNVTTVGNSLIIQVGAYTKYLGNLLVTVSGGTVSVDNFTLERIDLDNVNISGEPSPNVDPAGWAALVAQFNALADTQTMAAQIALPPDLGWNEPTVDNVTWGDFSGGQEQEVLIALGLLDEPYLWQTYSILDAFTQMETTLLHAELPYGDEEGPDDWFHQPAITQVDLKKISFTDNNLAKLATDSMYLRGALADLGDEEIQPKGLPGTPNDAVTDFGIIASGNLRSNILSDENGITLSEAYEVNPLGIGLKSFDLINGTPPDPTNPKYAPGFDLIRAYIKGAHVKIALEFGVASETFGMSEFFLHYTGVTFDYDQSKPLLQRVSNAMMGNSPLDESAVYKVTTDSYIVSILLQLDTAILPLLSQGYLTQEQYDTFISMKLYTDLNTAHELESLDQAYIAQPALYCGKQWIALCDKIMWPWWYGGLNGIILASEYPENPGLMNNITPVTFKVELEKKTSRLSAAKVISQLFGLTSDKFGFKSMYDLNNDGVIDQKDLNIVVAYDE